MKRHDFKFCHDLQRPREPRLTLPSKYAIMLARPLLKWPICWPQAGLMVDNTLLARRYLVSGVVQGVGFRFFVLRNAQKLNLAGYVKNLRDGRVEVYAIGTLESLDSFRRSLQAGPRGASVSGVSQEAVPLDSRFTAEFSIEHDAW